jgi:hypothetical protein
VESEEKRRGVAEELSIAGPLRGKSYCDFDRGHRDLCAEPGVRGDKKTVFTHKLTTFEQLKQIYTIFLVAFIRVMGGEVAHEIMADRVRYVSWLEKYRGTFTDKSLLEYDRQMRRRNPEGRWSEQFDQNCYNVLVYANTPITSPNPKRKGKQDKGKRGKDRGKNDNFCNRAKAGEECRHMKSKGECRFSHVCPKCKKEEQHVWADCK